jgi:hypothetical protein
MIYIYIQMATYYIYKICCEDDSITEFYVGSSKNVRDRKSKHKNACNKETTKGYNYKIYQTIRANGGWNNWRMVVIEEIPNTTKIGATIREEFYRVELSATLNMIRAYRSDEQRKEELKENKKKWDENNKEHKKKYHNEYNQIHKEEKKEYQRKYRATHREEINKTQRESRAMKKALISPAT